MIEITLENFQQVIIDESKNKLVLVSFWAEQVPESITLRDALATKVAPFTDHILLASVDCQSQGQIAQQFGIQGLPTAILVKDSQPLDGLSGPQEETTIAAFLDKYLPKAEDLLLQQAQTFLIENKLADALQAISQAYQENNERADIKLVLADVLLQSGKNDEARALLDSILMADQDSYYKALIAKLELADEAANSPEIQALETQLKNNPDDAVLTQQLAAQYNQVNRNEEALALLFNLVRAGGTINDDGSNSAVKSRELLLDILKSLPDGDLLATKYRRKLYTLMY
ncbi:tetratricopeptide repeat protein [Colwellia sp. D2M02]|nr:tetratricopeptide repeat protein [Colwellia sp. D2M02]MBU2893630.1 tetratricopeptide repeat protein [Colwellia sp. D2M02]